MGNFAVILPAAGRSTRFGDPKKKKIFAELHGRAVWLRAVAPFVNRDDVAQIVLAIAAEDKELFELRFRASAAFMNINVIEGGADRCDTVARALEEVDAACDFIAVHDAARPCLTTDQVDAVFRAAQEHGAALLATPLAETLKRALGGQWTCETVPREGLYLAQTPQAFERSLLCKAYARRSLVQARVTDDCQLVEALGHHCAIVESSALNIKITTQLDLKLAAAIFPLLEKPRRETFAHPFADEQAMWGNLPESKPPD
jgi:2-C-methyl-D-erythritol 4-phosphate cytidylyltransferase